MIEFRLGDRVSVHNPATGTMREGKVWKFHDDDSKVEMWLDLGDGKTLIVVNRGQEDKKEAT